MAADADRNLLFGTMAVQYGFATPDQIAAAMDARDAEGRPLGDVLTDQGVLDAAERDALDNLVELHARRHGVAPRGADPDPEDGLPATVGTFVHPVRPEPGLDPDPEEDLTATVGTAVHPVLPAGEWAQAWSRFSVLRPHAEGAFGVVSVALDGELSREVAFKEIKGERADDPNSRDRFEREARVTGGLEHPGIVPVYGFGRHADGRPYYAMRFISGRSLNDAIAEYHGGKAGMKPAEKNLAFRELLGRFADVCQAVGYAHSRGVIHRDIKPANVMLGPYGETLLVDWGLAKATGRSEAGADRAGGPLPTPGDIGMDETAAGTAMGTPSFMPPEQAAGRVEEVSARSDVYSLGATLANILTGEPPVTGLNMEEMLTNVREGRLVTRGPAPAGVPGPLWAVCDRATATEPAGRYASAGELAAEVQRHLADEPVLAKRDPLGVRARRWARRHPAVAAGAAVAALLVSAFAAVGLVVVSAYNRDLKAAKAEAEASLEEARWAVGDYLVRVTEDRRLKRAGFRDLRRWLLGAAEPFYRRLLKRRPGDREVEAGRAEAYFRLGKINQEVGEPAQAEADFRQCVAIFGRLAKAHPEVPELRLALASGHSALGNLLRVQGDPAGAAERHHRALALRRALADAHPDVPEYRHSLAGSHNDLGILLGAQRQVAAAGEQFRKAIEIHRALAKAHPDVPAYRRGLASNHGNLGTLLGIQGDPAGAAEQHRKALALRQALAEAHPKFPEYRDRLASSYNNLGSLLRDLGDSAWAAERLGRAIALRQALVKESPDVPEYRRELADSISNLGDLRKLQGDLAAAAALHRKAQGLFEALVEEHPDVPEYRRSLANSHNDLGALLRGRGDPAAAEQHRKAIALFKALAEEYPDVPRHRGDLAHSHNNLAAVFSDRGEVAKAARECREAIPLHRALADRQPDVPEYRHALATNHFNLGNFYRAQGDTAASAKQYRKAISLLRGLAHDFPDVIAHRGDLARNYSNLGDLLRLQGDLPAAAATQRRAATLRQALADDYPDVPEHRGDLANSHNKLGILLNVQGDKAGAAQQFRKAIALQQALADDHPDVMGYRVGLGGSYCNCGNLVRRADPEAALWWYENALSTLAGVIKMNPEQATAREFVRNTHVGRALALYELARFAEAANAWRAAARLVAGKGRERLQKMAAASEAMAGRSARLGRVLTGGASANPAERIEAAKYAYLPGKKLYAAAARQYRAAFAADPKLAADPVKTGHRYNAACCAALAAAGQGNEKFPAGQKTKWRRQALGWLRADLNVREKAVASADVKVSGPAKKALGLWLKDPDLAGVRGTSLKKLPAAERAAWQKLWGRVRAAAMSGALRRVPTTGRLRRRVVTGGSDAANRIRNRGLFCPLLVVLLVDVVLG